MLDRSQTPWNDLQFTYHSAWTETTQSYHGLFQHGQAEAPLPTGKDPPPKKKKKIDRVQHKKYFGGLTDLRSPSFITLPCVDAKLILLRIMRYVGALMYESIAKAKCFVIA